MTITKFTFSNLAQGKTEKNDLPPAPKNFSYFGVKDEVIPAEFTKEQFEAGLSESRNKGYDEGYEKGRQEVIQQTLVLEQATRQTIENAVTQLSNFLNSFEEQKKDFQRSMAKIAITAINKISSKIIQENTEEVILQAFEKAADVISKQPEIIFRVKGKVLAKIRDKVDNILKDKNFKGTVTFIADESVPEGNCILEWGKSGLSLNSSEVIRQIDEVLNEYIKSI